MVDGVGVCTVCAKVCHKDHEISYAKYGSFFCDCGAKEDGSCLVKCPDVKIQVVMSYFKLCIPVVFQVFCRGLCSAVSFVMIRVLRSEGSGFTMKPANTQFVW